MVVSDFVLSILVAFFAIDGVIVVLPPPPLFVVVAVAVLILKVYQPGEIYG